MRDRPLAGLVSEVAETLYARLVAAGSLKIGTNPGELDLASGPAEELFEARVIRRLVTDPGRIIPVTEATALQTLLTRHHRELFARQQRILHGWERLDSLLSSTVAAHGGGLGGTDPLVELVVGREEIGRVSAELYQSAGRELIGISTGRMTAPIHEYQLITPPEPSIARGARFRMLYDIEFASGKAGSRIIEESVRAGEEARIRPDLPLKMMHIDDAVALISLTPTGVEGSLLIRSPALLATLRQWFELLWDDSVTTTVDSAHGDELSATQRQVVRMLSSGLSDEAIARAMNSSVRTVRRHVTAILEILSVNTRFAAGVQATKRGWL